MKISSWVLGYILVAQAKTKSYIIGEILHTSIFVLASWVFIPYLGVKGAILAYLVSQIVYFVLVAYILRTIIFSRNQTR